MTPKSAALPQGEHSARPSGAAHAKDAATATTFASNTPTADPADAATAHGAKASRSSAEKALGDPAIKSKPADPRDQLGALLPNLRAFAIGLSRNVATADDLVQETIVKAWSNMDKFDPDSNLEAWLFTILRNTYYSLLRKTRREVQDSDGVHAAALFEKPAHDGRLAFNDFQRAFDKLSPEHREVLLLIGASGYSCEEVSGMMNVAVGTVKSRASRARKKLGELMGLAEGEDLFSGTDDATTAVISRSASRTT